VIIETDSHVIFDPIDRINMRSVIMAVFHPGFTSDRTMSRRTGAEHRRARRIRPRLLALEDRTLPSNVLIVTSASDSGNGSLRAAVTTAGPGDTITFSQKLFGKTITLTSGPIVDTGISLTIQGPGAARLAISGNDHSGIFDLVPTDPSQPPFAVAM
jgi:hypothetical protein